MSKSMTIKEIEDALGFKINIVNEHDKIRLSEVEQYNTFKIGDTDFIVLNQLGGKTFCLTRDFIANLKKYDDDTNYFAEASILNVLDNFEAKIAGIIGADNLCEFEIDLTTDDGLKDYGTITRKIGLLTDIQYREHSTGIEQYSVNDWWWLATALSTPKRDISCLVRCVAGGGSMSISSCHYSGGVRAVCILKSNIFVS